MRQHILPACSHLHACSGLVRTHLAGYIYSWLSIIPRYCVTWFVPFSVCQRQRFDSTVRSAEYCVELSLEDPSYFLSHHMPLLNQMIYVDIHSLSCVSSTFIYINMCHISGVLNGSPTFKALDFWTLLGREFNNLQRLLSTTWSATHFLKKRCWRDIDWRRSFVRLESLTTAAD